MKNGWRRPMWYSKDLWHKSREGMAVVVYDTTTSKKKTHNDENHRLIDEI